MGQQPDGTEYCRSLLCAGRPAFDIGGGGRAWFCGQHYRRSDGTPGVEGVVWPGSQSMAAFENLPH